MTKKLTISTVILTMFVLNSNPTNAAYENTYMDAASKAVDHIMEFHKDSDNNETDVAIKAENKPVKTLEVNVEQTKIQKTEKVEIKRTIIVTATAYSSTPWQTDDTPCVTATGYDVCNKTKNIIAVSRDLVRSLGYHKQVMLPQLYGEEIFYIEDTMNERFMNRIDVHHNSTKDAREFGLKRNIELQVI